MFSKVKDTALNHPPYFGLCLVAFGELCINALWGWMSASWWAHGLLLVLIYGGSEIAKWFAAEGIGEARRDKEAGRAWAWGLVLVCTLSISIPAHIGMIGYLRDGAVQDLSSTAIKHNNADRTVKDAAAELAAIGAVRAPGEIRPQADLECSRTSRSYKDGRGPKCTALLQELARAERKLDLQKIIGEAEHKLENNNASFADARIEVLGWIFPEQKPEKLQLIMSIAIALALEAITAFGFIAVGNRPDTKLTLDHLVSAGAATHPVADGVVAFRADMLEMKPGAMMTENELWQAYEAWSYSRQKEPMARAVFARIFQATGVRKNGDHYLGVRFKQKAA